MTRITPMKKLILAAVSAVALTAAERAQGLSL